LHKLLWRQQARFDKGNEMSKQREIRIDSTAIEQGQGTCFDEYDWRRANDWHIGEDELLIP
jgi:hypothetical protein